MIQTFYNDFRENWWQRDADVTENYNSGKGAGGKRQEIWIAALIPHQLRALKNSGNSTNID